MAETYSYTKTPLNRISDSLTKIFASMQEGEEGGSFLRAATTNLIFLIPSGEQLPDLEPLIDALSLVHPSRFFVVYVDNKLDALEAGISARCHGLSKAEHVCSEVVRLGVPAKRLAAVTSVIRSHILEGVSTELFLHDSRVNSELVKLILPMTDLILIDSAEYEDRMEEFSSIAKNCTTIIDLQWIGLGVWRDQIKDLFQMPGLCEYLPRLQNIEIKAAVKPGRSLAAAASLLSGWLVDRLHLAPHKFTQSTLQCRSEEGKSIAIKLSYEQGQVESRLMEVVFNFASDTGRIRLKRGAQLEVTVELGRVFKTSRPFDEESRAGRIRRYFLIGESITNYNLSLKNALEIERLKKGSASR